MSFKTFFIDERENFIFELRANKVIEQVYFFHSFSGNINSHQNNLSDTS